MMLFRDESRSQQYTYWSGNSDYYEGIPPQYFEYANSVLTGKTIGGKASLSVEYCFTPRFSAGLAGNFTWAELRKASFKSMYDEVEDQKLADRIDLSRIDYGISIRYNF